MKMTTESTVVVNTRVNETPAFLTFHADAFDPTPAAGRFVIMISSYPVQSYVEGTLVELDHFAKAITAAVGQLIHDAQVGGKAGINFADETVRRTVRDNVATAIEEAVR